MRGPNEVGVLSLLFWIYALPLLAYRVYVFVLPIREGVEVLSDPATHCRWLGGYQFQVVYALLPPAETLLKLIPGAFSLWLSLWGSRIGRSVYWAPNCSVTDRGFLIIGDGVLVGFGCSLGAHMIKSKNGIQTLYVEKIRVGSGALLGAFCDLGPGAQVGDGEFLPFRTSVSRSDRFSGLVKV
jgi:acetyltransferase-like isoleucine patch superfamily enzyme